MADRSVSVPVTLCDLERPNVKNQIFFRRILITLITFDIERPNSTG